MTLVRFTADDPAAAWRAGDLAEDLGLESPALPISLLRLAATGELLSLTEPWERRLIEPACPECCAAASVEWHEPAIGFDGPYTITCLNCGHELHVPAEATARTRIAALRAIVRDHAAARIDGMIVDAVTAGLLVNVYDALTPPRRERFGTVPLEKLVELGWKVAR